MSSRYERFEVLLRAHYDDEQLKEVDSGLDVVSVNHTFNELHIRLFKAMWVWRNCLILNWPFSFPCSVTEFPAKPEWYHWQRLWLFLVVDKVAWCIFQRINNSVYKNSLIVSFQNLEFEKENVSYLLIRHSSVANLKINLALKALKPKKILKKDASSKEHVA